MNGSGRTSCTDGLSPCAPPQTGPSFWCPCAKGGGHAAYGQYAPRIARRLANHAPLGVSANGGRHRAASQGLRLVVAGRYSPAPSLDARPVIPLFDASDQHAELPRNRSCRFAKFGTVMPAAGGQARRYFRPRVRRHRHARDAVAIQGKLPRAGLREALRERHKNDSVDAESICEDRQNSN